MIVTVFTVDDYFKKCREALGDDFHFSKCAYDGAVQRTMVIFSILPCEIFAVQLMIKFTGEK